MQQAFGPIKEMARYAQAHRAIVISLQRHLPQISLPSSRFSGIKLKT